MNDLAIKENRTTVNNPITPELITFQSWKTALAQDSLMAPGVIKFGNKFCDRVTSTEPRDGHSIMGVAIVSMAASSKS